KLSDRHVRRIADHELSHQPVAVEEVAFNDLDSRRARKRRPRLGRPPGVEFDAEQTRRPHTLPLNPPEHARDKLAGPTTRIEHEVTGTRPSSGEQLPDHAIHDVLRRGNES